MYVDFLSPPSFNAKYQGVKGAEDKPLCSDVDCFHLSFLLQKQKLELHEEAARDDGCSKINGIQTDHAFTT